MPAFSQEEFISRGYAYGIKDKDHLANIIAKMSDYMQELETYFPGVIYRFMVYRTYATESEMIAMGLRMVRYLWDLEIKVEAKILCDNILDSFEYILGKYQNGLGTEYTTTDLARIRDCFKERLYNHLKIDIREKRINGKMIRIIIQKV